MRCIECGGPVLTITSTGCSFKYFFRNRTDGFTQLTLGSGMNRLPRTHIASLCFRLFFCWFIGLTCPLPPLENLRYMPYISDICVLTTSVPCGISSRSVVSVPGASGFSGVYITVSQPSAGRYLANFTHLCTPDPPAGGQ